jgi:hypothetical protein
MRQPIGIGALGDGVLSTPPPFVEGGWSLSTEVSPMDPLAPLLVYAVARDDSFSPVPPGPWKPLASPPERALPWTMHQVLYQWPDSGVGPHVTYEGVVKDAPPKELPPGIVPWGVRALPPAVSSFDPVPKNWDSATRIEEPKAPPAMYEGQGFFAEITRRKDNPHFAYFLRGGWIGDSSQDALYVAGTTLDSTGAPLGGCTVVLLDAARMVANPNPFANPVVATTVSNASGLYSFVVRGGRGYQVVAYLPGSPDVAGVTRNDLQAALIP